MIAGTNKYKITGVLVVLKEDGEARITLYTELQLYVMGRWSAGKDLSDGITLKITEGAVSDNLDGDGKLFLRADGKSITRLTMQAKAGDGMKYEADFVADNNAGSH